jgi:CubicO group peptidase (beta-lactamase class C family)
MTLSFLPQAALGLGCGALLAACAGGQGRTPARAQSTAPISAASPVDPRARLAAGIDAIFSGYGRAGARVPGCSVGVYRAGEIVYSKGYGFADLEHDAPNTDTTLFHLASIAKQFSAAAVLLLAQDGKLALGDDVRKYVPELPDHGTRITLDQLLHHTSGVRDYGLLLELQGGGGVDLVTAEDILWLLGHQRGENFVPGTRYLYSNSGYVLLSLVVERASGKTYGAFVKERIFDPLGMTDTLVKDDHARIIPRRAVGYARRPDGTYRTATSNTEYTGQGNILSTARDLAKWDANFYAPKVGGVALVDAMRIQGRLTDGTPIEYAMGLVEDVAHGLPRESHSGGLAGYRTRIARYPTEKLTVTVLCNDGSANADALEKKVASLFLPALGVPAVADPAAPAGTGQGGPATRPVPDGHGEGIPAPRFDEYVGRYGSEELARDLEIVVKDGHLARRTWGGRLATAPLRPTSHDVFAEDDVVWTFERDTRGSVRGVVVSSEPTRGVQLQKR